MPPKIPRASYTGKPVRRLKLPKIGPTKTTNFFEEYLFALLAFVFFAVTILGCAHQLKDYFTEKSKTENGKTSAPQPQAATETTKGPLPLPSGMKPMIGLQWPVKSGARPSWPKLPPKSPPKLLKEQPAAPEPQAIQPPAATWPQTSQADSNDKKRAFVYERPTLPDRKPKLPNNWGDLNDQKPKDKKRDHKKPK